MVDQAHLAPGLRLQHAHQVGVGHGGQRVVLHAALVQQHIACKQIALEHRALVVRKSRGGNAEIAAQRIHQGLRHRADIAGGGAVKGRAVFEIDLLRALALQPAQGIQRLGDGLISGDGARLEGDHHSIHLGTQRAAGHANGLHHAHAGADQVVGQVGGAGKVVGNAAQLQGGAAHRWPPSLAAWGRVMPGKILITALSSSLA